MRCIMDDISDDFEARQTVIFSIISDYDVWAGGRVEKLIKDDKEYMDYTVTKELAIEETISLTYQEFGIELNEEECLKHPYQVHTLRHYTGALTDIRPAKTEFFY